MGDPRRIEKGPDPKEGGTTAEEGHRRNKRKKRKKSKKEKQQNSEKSTEENTTQLSPSRSNDKESPSVSREEKNNAAKNPKQSIPQQQQPPGSHPFEVDDSDHCETPLRAYQDICVILDQLLLPIGDTNNATKTAPVTTNRNNRKPRSSLRIYDPYYCDGGVKIKLASMGFTNVINENRDFYQDIATNQVPEYDVLVTNPPYSGHHMEKLLDFCVKQSSKKKPCLLLLPHFVYTKDYYSEAKRSFSFLVPSMRYSYVPPSWVAHRSGAAKALAKGKDTTAPFPSFWYYLTTTTTSSKTNTNSISKLSAEWLTATFGSSGSIKSKHSSGLRYADSPLDIPREFKGEFDPTKKRPNPRARKRMRMAAAAAANGGPTPVRQQQKQRQRQRDPKKKKKRRY